MLQSFIKNVRKLLAPDLKIRLYRIPEKLEKLGTKYGGWAIPATLIDQNAICYLAGAGEDISFDVALAHRCHCKVFIFDPTPRSRAHYHNVIKAAGQGKSFPVNNNNNEWYTLDKDSISNLQFFPIGIWKQTDVLRFFAPKNEQHISHSISNMQHTDTYFEATVQRVSDIMREHGHSHLDILKLDIEGAEYDVIDSILADNLKIKILCAEFHLSDNHGFNHIQSTLQKLEENNYKIIAREDLDFTFINLNMYRTRAK